MTAILISATEPGTVDASRARITARPYSNPYLAGIGLGLVLLSAQGWVFLKSLGYNHVYFLRGGLYEWLDDVMNPTVSPSASDSVRKAFEKVAAVSRYFGGVPRVADSTSGLVVPSPPHSQGVAPKATKAVARVRGRGC